MRKLGIWGGPILTAMLLVGAAGLAAGPALAQDRGVPWLGVMTQSLSDGLRDGMDYEGEGVLVSQVVNDSPASRAGIRKGDVLVSVNSRGFDSPNELSRVIRSARVGQNVSVVLSRDGRKRTVSVRLGERPEDSDLPDMNMDELRDLPRKMGDDDAMREWRSEGDDMPGMTMFRGMGRGRLGVRIEDLNDDLGAYFDAPQDKGVLIVQVMRDTPAEKAGLKAGDVIIEVGDQKISDSEDLVKTLRDQGKGDVSITVMRKGDRRTMRVELEDAPHSMHLGPGRDMTIIRPRLDSRGDRIERRDLRKGQDSDDSEELRQLREEVRQLRQRLHELEDQGDDQDQGKDKDKDDDDGR